MQDILADERPDLLKGVAAGDLEIVSKSVIISRHLAAQYPVKFYSAVKKYFQQIGSP